MREMCASVILAFLLSASLCYAKEILLAADSSNRRLLAFDVNYLDQFILVMTVRSEPFAIDYDTVGHVVHFTDGIKNLYSLFFNGTHNENLQYVFSKDSLPRAIAVDSSARLIFLADQAKIVRKHIDTQYTRVLISSDLSYTDVIVLHSQLRVMFWGNWGDVSKIERANYDGSDRRTLVSTNQYSPTGLTLDVKGNRLYWVYHGANSLEQSDLNGMNRMSIVFTGTRFFFRRVKFYNNSLFVLAWTSAESGTKKSIIWRMDTTGKNAVLYLTINALVQDICFTSISGVTRDHVTSSLRIVPSLTASPLTQSPSLLNTKPITSPPTQSPSLLNTKPITSPPTQSPSLLNTEPITRSTNTTGSESESRYDRGALVGGVIGVGTVIILAVVIVIMYTHNMKGIHTLCRTLHKQDLTFEVRARGPLNSPCVSPNLNIYSNITGVTVQSPPIEDQYVNMPIGRPSNLSDQESQRSSTVSSTSVTAVKTFAR